jgi:hypothetical protein
VVGFGLRSYTALRAAQDDVSVVILVREGKRKDNAEIAEERGEFRAEDVRPVELFEL